MPDFRLCGTTASARRLFFLIGLICLLIRPVCAQSGMPSGGNPVLTPNSLLTTPVGGLERTRATAQVVPIASPQPFRQALHVTIGSDSPETNVTQLTMRTATPVAKGDTLLASLSVRGAAASGKGPAQIQLLFEQANSPWTKSVTQGIVTARDRTRWKRVLVPFTASESYAPGEAMLSLRFAFGPQTLDVADLSVVNYAQSRSVADLVALTAERNTLGAATVAIHTTDLRQKLLGLGGDFAQPRYGATEAMDAVGAYNLAHLRVAHARIGIPLNSWTPRRGVYTDSGPAHAALLQMQRIGRRHISIAGSIWEGPLWMLPGTPEQGRTLPRDRYADCIEAIARFLTTARDKYGVTIDNVSFNEPDYGVNFKFSPAEMADFVAQAGPRFRALGLKTRFLIGDTASGDHFADYARPLLQDRRIAPYLGPIAFHCWDVLSASDSSYQSIAALGRRYGKPIWCTEAGHDAQLWQAANPWESWDNALKTALAYERTLRLSGASLMDYWTYQDNYPLVSMDGTRPFPVWQVLKQMEEGFAPGSWIAFTTSSNDALKAIATFGPTRQLSVLLINPIGAGRVTISGLPSRAKISVVQSTRAGQRQIVARAVHSDSTGRVTIDLPSRAVVTLSTAW